MEMPNLDKNVHKPLISTFFQKIQISDVDYSILDIYAKF